MSDMWNQPDDDFDDEGNENGEGARKPNPVRDRMRKLEKENAELKKANEKLAKETRKSSVTTLLGEAKVKHASKVAALVPSDVEATTEAVKKWLDEYSDVFSIETEETDEGNGSEEEPSPEQVEQAQKMQRINKATTATTTPTKQADLMKQIADAKSRDELLALVEQAGGGVGSG